MQTHYNKYAIEKISCANFGFHYVCKVCITFARDWDFFSLVTLLLLIQAVILMHV